MRVPIGISNRHVHLSQKDADKLFGAGYEFKKFKDLSQPGQYACDDFLTLVGPKNKIERVRYLGPIRKETQVEISISDAFTLGVEPIIRISSDIKGTPGLKLVGPAGEIEISQGVIVAQRHIHISVAEANHIGLKNKDIVKVRVEGPRALTFDQVSVRVSDSFELDCHIDMDEANAGGLKLGAWGEIIY